MLNLRFGGAMGWAAVGLTLLSGCGGKVGGDVDFRPVSIAGEETPELRAQAKVVQRDPVAYLHRVADKCAQLEDYTLKFTRYERRGLLKLLFGPEHIDAWYRQEPFSVRLLWTDPDIKYGESVYVADQHDGKVRFVTRYWVPPLLPPPRINNVDLQTPVIWGESRQPMSDFGLERLMERSLATLAEANDDATVEYLGIEEMPHGHERVHHLRLSYTEGRYTAPVQELYVSVDTDLPRGTELRQNDDTLEAAYYYEDVNTDVELTDDDFLLTVEREDDGGGASKKDS